MNDVLIWNPYRAVKALNQKDRLQEAPNTALLQRAFEPGATNSRK